jgi:hypothetical protein
MSLSRAGLGSHLRQLPRLSAFSGRAQYVPRHLLATKPPYQYNFSISVRTRINPSRPNVFRAFRPFRPRFNSSKPSPDINAQLGSPPSSLSFSQRLKALSKEYGWTAVGVYIGLSILDFPFCFLAVRVLGTDRIGRWEHAVIEKFWGILAIPFPSLGMKTQPVEGGPDVAREGAAVAHDTSSHNEESAGKIY